MATKMYLHYKGNEYSPPAYRGTWNSTTSIAATAYRILIDPNKYGGETGYGTLYSEPLSGATSSPWKHGHTLGISRKLLPQTISGTVDVVIGVGNPYSGNHLLKLHIYVVNETTGLVHGTLLNNYEEGAAPFPATATGRALLAPQTLTSVTIPSDANKYRLIVEFGSIYTGTVPNSDAGFSLSRGVQSYEFVPHPDMTVGETTLNDAAGFLNFSADILLDAFIGGSNIDPSTAIVIPSLPYSITMDPGVGYPTMYYWKYIPIADKVISILACGATVEDINVAIYHGTVAPYDYQESWYGAFPKDWPVKVGQGLLFEVYVDNYVAGNQFTFSVIEGPQDPIQVGDLIISEDYGHGHVGDNIYDPTIRGKFPWVWYSDAGTVRYVTAKLPASELGCCLTNGKWGTIDHDNLQIFIYDMPPALTEIGRFVLPIGPVGGVFPSISSLATDFNFFYVIASEPHSTPSKIFKVTDVGVITGPIATLDIFPGFNAAGSGGNSICGVSRDGSILYYPHTIVGGQIHRHNLLTNTALSSFPSPSLAWIPADTLVMNDGTIVAIFYHNFVNKVIHYSSTGTILHTLDFGTSDFEIHHIVHEAHNNPDLLWVWTQNLDDSGPTETGLNKFQLVQLSTGTIIKEFTRNIFVRGQGGLNPASPCNTERFGAPDSCPLMVVMKVDAVVTPPVDLSGLYFINPAASHDIYYTDDKKIPNPTIKTTLFGE